MGLVDLRLDPGGLHCAVRATSAAAPGFWAAMGGAVRSLPGSVRVATVHLGSWLAEPGPPHEPVEAAAHSPGRTGWEWLARPDLVSVAVMHGGATGDGLHLALACDLRIMSDDAWIAVRESAAATVPTRGSTAALVDVLGYSRALHAMLTGRRMSAAELRQAGLAAVTVPADRLEAAAADFTAALLAVPRAAAIESKALLLAAMSGRAAQARAEQAARDRLAVPDEPIEPD